MVSDHSRSRIGNGYTCQFGGEVYDWHYLIQWSNA